MSNQEESKRPNFIFFFPDEMRAESVSCYGHPLVQMPNYDRVASEGVRFDQCHVQHPVCSPSRCSLMTGWYPHVRGHRTLWNLLRPHEPSLFRYLKEAGYEIEWHGKNDVYSPEYFPLAVDNWDSSEGMHMGGNPYSPDDPEYFSFLYEPFDGDLDDTWDMHNVSDGLEFLRNRNEEDPPFFLYYPLAMPHPPYGAPQPYHDMYDPQDIETLRPPDLPGKPDYHELIRRYRHLDQVPKDIFARIQAIYLGMNSYVDWMLGEILRVLEETGLDQNTTLIISSDHGDWAGDYGLVEKWPSALDDTLTRVPLIIRTPNGAEGHVVEEQVELFDLMPTVLELAGLEAEHVHFAQSLVPQLGGAAGDAERAVYCEGGYDPHEPHCFEGRAEIGGIWVSPTHIYYPKGAQQQEYPASVCRSTMLRTLEYKLVRRTSGLNELYDLIADPCELNNVYDEAAYTAVRAELESRMLDWYIHTADAVETEAHPRGLPPSP